MDVILSGLSLLHEPDEIIEIRSIDPKPVISGYFRADSPAIAKELSRYPNRTFYQTMNRVKSACYAREQHERLVERPHETTTDGDIAGYQWLLIDADPVRPSGVSASREEKEAARRVAGMTMKKLMAMGFSEPIVADSGKSRCQMNGLQTAHNVRNLIKIGFLQIEIQNQKRYDLFVTRIV